MSSIPTADEIAADASWLPQALDPAAGLVRLVRMERETYRSASFLDDRMFQERQDAHVVPLKSVLDAVAQGARRDARWIFHIGHVGSTLISRLLGEIGGVLSVREPRILRDLTVVPAEQRSLVASALQALLSRTFDRGELAAIKATSFVSEIAPNLVPPSGRAQFIFAQPVAYICGILAGENSVKELRMLAEHRAGRMAQRVPAMTRMSQSDAHLAAAAWACEMTSLEAAAAAMSDRAVLWSDFDDMLADMPKSLLRTAEFFGFALDQGTAEAIASGPLMRCYSKALEYDYSPSLRRELLEEAWRSHSASITDAVAMLHEAAAGSPLLRSALNRSKMEV